MPQDVETKETWRKGYYANFLHRLANYLRFLTILAVVIFMLRWFLWFLCFGLWYISLDGAKIWCSTTIIRTFKKYFCMISHRKSWIFIPSFLLFEQMPCFSVLAKSVYDTFKVSNTSITNTYNLAHPCQSWTSLIKPPTPTATHIHFPPSHTQWDALPQHILAQK